MIVPTAMPRTGQRFVDVVIGESVRFGNHLITVLDTEQDEVRVMIETINDPEPMKEDEIDWDDSWQSRV